MGFGEWLEEDPICRFCMLNRRNHTRSGHDWNPMPDMELESLWGVRIFGRGVREKGGSGGGFGPSGGGVGRPEPPPPPGYGPAGKVA